MKQIFILMALFRLCSDITIGSFRFQGVHDVRIKRSMQTYKDVATLKLPSVCRISQGNSSSPTVLTTGTLFKDGDAVTINLGYSNVSNAGSGGTPVIAGSSAALNMVTEFQGFVKRRNLNMPLEVECEGYSYQLRQTKSRGFFKEISVKDLLGLACIGTDITLQCDVDYSLVNVSLNDNTGEEICDFVRSMSEHALALFFIEPTVLWCGLPYTAMAGGNVIGDLPMVNYRLGWNVVKDNGLKERIPSEPVNVILNGKLATGSRVFTQAMYKTAKRTVKKLLNNVGEAKSLSAYAQEMAYTHNYLGYQGSINGFLQPFCWPGWMANIVDDRYAERNGVYLVEGTDVSYGSRGARRTVSLGPQLNFGTNYLNALSNG